MGLTHKVPATFPRLSDVAGFCAPEDVIKVAEHTMCIQRDFGDRKNRAHARSYLAEIALVGKVPGKYNLYLGANASGDRLNFLYKENIGEEQILSTLRALLS